MLVRAGSLSLSLGVLASLTALHSAQPEARLIREYRTQERVPRLASLSPSGTQLLTVEARKIKCADPKSKLRCSQDVLSIFDTSSGRRRKQFTTEGEGRFYSFGFLTDQLVSAVEYRYDAKPRLLHTWNLVDETSQLRELPEVTNERLTCPISPESRLLVRVDNSMAIADKGGILNLSTPVAGLSNDPRRMTLGENCQNWRKADSYLIDVRQADHPLFWVSTNPNVAPRPCRSFPQEELHGYAVSPDGASVAVITSQGDKLRRGLNYTVFVSVLDSTDCQLTKRMQLTFPEKPKWKAPLLAPRRKYLDQVPFPEQFAEQVTISPDHRLLAIAYGVYEEPHGQTYIGLYSLEDGRRLATLKGDAYKCGLLHGAWMNDNLLWCGSSPISGEMRFSPDSKTLFAVTKNVQQWDISMLQ